MHRRVRRVWSTNGSKLATEHRNDELAEHLKLFEHDALRQPGVIDEEQLALVVADVFAEAQRPVDDLLGLPTVSGVWAMKSSSDGPPP